MKVHHIVSVLVLFSVNQNFCNAHLPCILPMMDFSKTPVFRPLIYKLDGTLYPVSKEKIRIPTGDEFLVSCENNFIRSQPGQHNLTLKCDDETLMINNDPKQTTTFKDLSCDIRVLEDVKHDIEGCSFKDGGLYYQYYNSRQGENVVLAEVCFDYSEDQTKFIRFKYPQDYSLKHTAVSQQPSLISHKITMLQTYRSDVVREKLTALLGEDFKLVGQSIDGIRLMTKRFVNEQFQDIERFSATNMAGVWTSVVNGNWENIMNDIEVFGKDRKNPLQVIIGAHNTQVLNHYDGREVRMFLKDGNKVPVPEFLWAIVYDKEKNQGVAMVTLNNPFAQHEKLKIHEFCPSRCNEITWLKHLRKNNNFDKPIYGYTYCCKIDNFPMYPLFKKLDLLKV